MGSGSDADRRKKKEKKEPKKPKSKTVSEKPRKRRQKKEKDENKPKRPQSAYFLWLNDNREKIKKENPGISITELTKMAGQKWRELDDKKEWEDRAAEAKVEYEEAMKEYKASGGGADAKSKKSKSPKKATP